MSPDVNAELFAAAREVEACKVRLRLLPTESDSDQHGRAFRQELEQARAHAAQRLATLESAHGWDSKADPNTA
jgi:hypothetical protein